jgi:S-formylglutathione hydrolase
VGHQSLERILGEKHRASREYDAVDIEDGAGLPDRSSTEAMPTRSWPSNSAPNAEESWADAGIPLNLQHQPGYDHSYYFVSTFMEERLRWHADRLRR